MAINLIRRNNQSEVTAYHDTVIFHAMKGVNGVFQDVGTGFATAFDNNTKIFTIYSGMGMVYGRQFEVFEGEEITFNWSALAPPKYISVYIEIDLRNPTLETAAVKATYDNSAYPVITAGDNLIATPLGVARLEMFRIYLASSGITKTVRYNTIQNANIATADHATESDEATHADDADSVGGNTIYRDASKLKIKYQSSATAHAIPVMEVLFDGSKELHNTTGIGQTIQLAGAISVGDILEFIYLPCKNISGSGHNVFSKAYVRSSDLRITATTAIGNDTVPSTYSQKMVFVSNSFSFAGNTLTYQGGYRLNPSGIVSEGLPSFSESKTDTIRITRIIRIVGGAGV